MTEEKDTVVWPWEWNHAKKRRTERDMRKAAKKGGAYIEVPEPTEDLVTDNGYDPLDIRRG